MIFQYLAFSCFLYYSKFRLNRRENEISFVKQSSMIARSNEDSWYFVQFHFQTSNKSQMISDLQKQGIELNSTNCVSKNIFNLYLTPYQVQFITSNHLGEVHEIDSDNKIVNIPPKNWSYLIIETINSRDMIEYYKNFKSNIKCQYTFYYATQNTFSIKGTQECLTSFLSTLTQDKKINAISYSAGTEELNCRATGFVQKNTANANFSIDQNDGSNLISIDRFLNKQGLDGSGVKVLVVDTFLDTNSTYFYDPNHPVVAFNEFTNGHRKIDYISALETAQIQKNDHGTHTSGSIAGRALNDSDSSSYYNGCAPGARLSFFSDNGRLYPPKEIANVVDIVKPQVSTNSWQLIEQTTLEDSIWDQIAFEKNDTLFVFAAGNSAVTGEFDNYDGFRSIKSPGSAKNLLTVGATGSVYVDENSIGTDKKEIYVTIEEDAETTYLSKIMRWSIEDYESNDGLKYLFESGRLKVEISRNPYSFGNNTVLVIDNREQFESLSRENPPYFVISTFEFDVDNFSSYGFKRTFPVIYMSNDTIPQYESNIIESNYRTSKGYKRAEFSSKGTGNLGLMKPDVMCPGVSIVSARGVVDGPENHKELTIKHGTSMATPICAGASAIIFQYFMEGKYRNKPIKPSSSLVRSFIITCSDPLTNEVHPNCEEGHGMLNLGKYIGNGFDIDNAHFLIGDRLKLTSEGSSHLMSTFSVADNTTDVRVTLSYVDAVLSPDSAAALAVDIDLVVVSPSGVAYRGNMRTDGTEEHYSTNERVIIRSGEVEKGDYEIHIFSSIPSNLPNLTNLVEFAVTVYGSLDNGGKDDFLQFKKATKCIPVDHGECNEETFDNDCYNEYLGRSCQIQMESHSCYVARKVVKVPPYGLKYITFYYPPMDEQMSVTYRITPVTEFDPKIWAFYEKVRMGGPEMEADKISVRNGFVSEYKYDPLNLPESEVYMLCVIYNTSPYPTDFVLTSDTIPYIKPPETETETEITASPSTETQTELVTLTKTATLSPTKNEGDNSKTESSDWKKIAIVSTCLTSVFAVISIVLIILIILLIKKKRQNENSDQMQSIHNPLLA